MAEPIVRPAAEADMPGLRAVAHHFGVLETWPKRPDFLDAERVFGAVFVGEVGGTIVGFGGTLRRGAVTHLGDLFVLPEHQSSGVGRAILSRLLPRDTPKVTFASADTRALALYVRNGMRPRCPLLYLEQGPVDGRPARPEGGRAKDVPPAPGPHGPAAGVHSPAGTDDPGAGDHPAAGADSQTAEAHPVAATDGPAVVAHSGMDRQAVPEADISAAAGMDARVSGGDRAATLTWYAALPGVTTHVSGSGYAFVRVTADTVVIGPAGGATPQDCVDVVLETARAHSGAKPVRVAVPGPHPLLPLLLREGWRIDEMDTLMTSDDFLRPDCYIPHPDLG